MYIKLIFHQTEKPYYEAAWWVGDQHQSPGKRIVCVDLNLFAVELRAACSTVVYEGEALFCWHWVVAFDFIKIPRPEFDWFPCDFLVLLKQRTDDLTVTDVCVQWVYQTWARNWKYFKVQEGFYKDEELRFLFRRELWYLFWTCIFEDIIESLSLNFILGDEAQV